MDPEKFWTIANDAVGQQILKIKQLAEEARTRVKFFRFGLPDDSHNVKSLVYDADGVFVVVTFRHCMHRYHPANPEIGAEVVEVIFRAEIGKFDK